MYCGLLTSYNKPPIEYDAIGNPITYRDGMSMLWSNGRQLDSYTKDGKTVSYTYDTDGIRLTKTVDNVKYTYLYENGLLIQETRGDKIFDYSYDANGSIRMLTYRANATATAVTLYYALNTRGDVIGLYNSQGSLVVKYTYDPWGNTTSITNATGNDVSNSTGVIVTQPFRYRSYYYDTDSGFYYLQSRYYDPVTHRFINADGYVSTGAGVIGHNMFAYCNNNPVNCCDPSGMSSHYCGDPTCFKCRPERRDFINYEKGVEWYNNVTGSNIKCITYTGEIIYNTPIIINTESTEYKVFRTIGIGLESLEFGVDVGSGIGYYYDYYGIVGYGAEAITLTYHWEFTGHSGVDSGACITPISVSGHALGIGDTLEWSAFINNEGVITPTKGFDDSTTLFSIGYYYGIGGALEIGFNNKHFINEATKLW